jgi:hypothetical protein
VESRFPTHNPCQLYTHTCPASQKFRELTSRANLSTTSILPALVRTGSAEVVMTNPVAEPISHADVSFAGDAAGRGSGGALAGNPVVSPCHGAVGVIAGCRDRDGPYYWGQIQEVHLEQQSLMGRKAWVGKHHGRDEHGEVSSGYCHLLFRTLGAGEASAARHTDFRCPGWVVIACRRSRIGLKKGWLCAKTQERRAASSAPTPHATAFDARCAFCRSWDTQCMRT